MNNKYCNVRNFFCINAAVLKFLFAPWSAYDLCKWMPRVDFLACVSRSLGETEKVTPPDIELIDDHGISTFFLCVFFLC